MTSVPSSRAKRPKRRPVTTSSVWMMSTRNFSLYSCTCLLANATATALNPLGLKSMASKVMMVAGILTVHSFLPWNDITIITIMKMTHTTMMFILIIITMIMIVITGSLSVDCGLLTVKDGMDTQILCKVFREFSYWKAATVLLLLHSQWYLWGSPFWVRFWCTRTFSNPTTEVVTFHLRGWCMLGVFLLPVFTGLGHKCQDLLSPCYGVHVCTD